MSNIDITSMFDSIKNSLKMEKRGGGSFKEILKMEPVNTYIVRLLPHLEDTGKTFFHYCHHGWKSFATGQYNDFVCPSTWDERCPICEEMFKLYRTKTEENKKLAKNLNRMDKHLVNTYVIDDPTNKDNNGTVKILRMGIRLYEKVQSATDGDDSSEFGARVYDLSEKGCNFKIKVETNSKDGKSEFTNYSNSRFTSPCAIDGLTPDKVDEIYKSTHKLEDFVGKVRTYDELKKMLDIHFHGKIDGAEVKSKSTVVVNKPAPEDNLDMGTKKTTTEEKPAETKVVENTPAPTAAAATPNKAKIDNLLADLDKI
jgi:hypothetical protein